MSITKAIERIKQANHLIAYEITGKPADFAKKLNISKRSLSNLIREMRGNFNVSIVFDKKLQTYKYEVEGSIVIAFVKDNKTKNTLV
ncbi:hypothetical protein JMN32_14815 [Fulvivirga sp. 29W222]|uniref:Uncharacterized protein n=1 Tax=Fulvivirga marina TaxID=2494733 RepID=A0A937KEW6_9BACT|nr:hypothetical protein [Fulvivirga marina]MBL6447588.1 hypothetical protein [Fulvivirga marina]